MDVDAKGAFTNRVVVSLSVDQVIERDAIEAVRSAAFADADLACGGDEAEVFPAAAEAAQVEER